MYEIILLLGVLIVTPIAWALARAEAARAERQRRELGRDLRRLHQRRLAQQRAAAPPLPRWGGLPIGASADLEASIALLRATPATTTATTPTPDEEHPMDTTDLDADHRRWSVADELRSSEAQARRDARLVVLVGATISFVASVALWFGGAHDAGLFVGLWVPSILAFGGFVLRDER